MRHIHLTCRNHPNLRWLTKSIAWSNEHGYNGMRHIHYIGQEGAGPIEPECPCKADSLILAPGETGVDETE